MNIDVQKVKAIFQAAVDESPPGEWESFVDSACDGNVDLRREVLALLRAHEMGGSLLDEPILAGGADHTALLISERPGTQVGPYKLLQQIGQGGMGVVFMAQQTHPVRRIVALKIIKPGMDTQQVVVRFEAERQALAMMDHPNIARVLMQERREKGLRTGGWGLPNDDPAHRLKPPAPSPQPPTPAGHTS